PTSRSTALRCKAGSARHRVSRARRLRSQARPEPFHLGGLELPALAGLEPFQGQPRVAAPVEPGHGVADGGEHPLDLVLPPLVEDELDPASAETARSRRRSAAVVEI